MPMMARPFFCRPISVPQTGTTGDEGARAVDRIDHPDMLAVETDIAVLFTQDTVIGKFRFDERPDRHLGSAVTLGHRVEPLGLLVDHIDAWRESAAGSRALAASARR